jgi:hypothetical protein
MQRIRPAAWLARGLGLFGLGCAGIGCTMPIAPGIVTVPPQGPNWSVEVSQSEPKEQILLTHSVGTQTVYDAIITVSWKPGNLVDIAGESLTPTALFASGGLSAIYLYRLYSARVDGDNERRIGPQQRPWTAITWATALPDSATGEIVRLEVRINPDSPTTIGDITDLIANLGNGTHTYQDPDPAPDPELVSQQADLQWAANLLLPHSR